MAMPHPNTKDVCLVCGSRDLLPIASLSGIPTCAQPFIENKPSNDIKESSSTSLTAYQCTNCTHVQSDSPLVPYYKKVITTASLSSSILSVRDNHIVSFSRLLSIDDPAIIEIGMYQGQYLKHLNSLGYQHVYGIEACPKSVSVAVSAGIDCQVGYLLDSDFEMHSQSFFDIILCFNFLEHIPDPLHFLTIIKNKIASNKAIFYFTMPSFHYIKSQMLLQEFVPDHVSYFTPDSLSTLFHRCNLKLHSLNSFNNGNDLEVVAIYEKPDISPLSNVPIDLLISQINYITEDSFNTNQIVAFWGAGHRSLTLISQLSFSKISFIVDSASFKQGTYCPDTGIPIFSPSVLNDNQVDVLFLSLPGSYASEVINSLRESSCLPSQIYLIEGNILSQLYP